MRKILMMAAALCCMVFTSCSSDDDDSLVSPEQTAEYTIIYYANGGGNVDSCILPMISDFYKANPNAYKKVNVVVQYKFSTIDNMSEQYDDSNTCETFGGKTVRWAVDPAKTFQDQIFSKNNIYGEDNADCACPDSLTNFINWAAKAYPAKKYMLIVNDHGGGYQPNDELPEAISAKTRGLLYDDGNDNKHFTAKSFTRAIRQANVRFETIYMLACLMNCLEYQFEMQDICDYVIASTYTMPATGGALNLLPELLSQPSVNIEEALTAYCKADVESWDEGWEIDETTPIYTDMTITRTSAIANLGKVLREFTDRLCDTYTNGTDAQRQVIDYCTASATKVQLSCPNYDAIKYMGTIVYALPEVYDDDFCNKIKDAFNNCIVGQYFSRYLTAHDYMVDYSVLLGTFGTYSYMFWNTDENTGEKTPYAEYIYADNGEMQPCLLKPTDDPQYYRQELYGGLRSWDSTLADTYEQLAFDRATGWSRWIRLNRQLPNMFCPSGLNFELPMPEDGQD